MGYYREHGSALALVRRFRRMATKVFSRIVNLKLKTPGGLRLDPSAQILGMRYITIGRNFKVGRHFKLEAIRGFGNQSFTPRVVIGDGVEIHDFVHIGCIHGVEIGNHVLMASKIFISDHNHGFYAGEAQSDPEVPPAKRALDDTRKVVIEDNVWLGEFVSVLPGAHIGRGSIIGANSVVMGEIPPHCIAVGTPARVVKRYDPEAKAWVPVPRSPDALARLVKEKCE